MFAFKSSSKGLANRVPLFLSQVNLLPGGNGFGMNMGIRGIGSSSFGNHAIVPNSNSNSGSSTASSVISSRKESFYTASYKRRFRKSPKRLGGATMPQYQPVAVRPKDMSNETLITLDSLGRLDAREEILIRHIMAKDRIPRTPATAIFHEIERKNDERQLLRASPYLIGICVALTAASSSFPLVFEYNTVSWFNANFVTADVPEPKDLETFLEVGSWAWNWMEPCMGQTSFVLLCLQWSRNQFGNLGFKPFTNYLKEHKALRLVKAFPQYDSYILINYSLASPLFDTRHLV